MGPAKSHTVRSGFLAILETKAHDLLVLPRFTDISVDRHAPLDLEAFESALESKGLTEGVAVDIPFAFETSTHTIWASQAILRKP